MTHEQLTITLALPAEGGAEPRPPSELRIFPKGSFQTKKGTFTFDDKAAETVMAEYAEHGTDKHFDYWHDSVKGEMRGADRVAAAWHKLEVRDGELWATDIEWTPPATEQIRNKQFRYLSPAFTVDRETKRVVELISTSLVNLPATRKALPLVAAEAGDPVNGDTRMANTIAVALGLSPDASEGDVLAKLSRDREVVGDLVKLSGKHDAREALGVVLAWKADAEKLAVSQTELARLQAEKDAKDIADAVEACIKDGRLMPAERDKTLENARTYGKPAALAFLSTLQPRVALASSHAADVTPGKTTSTVGVRMPSVGELKLLNMTAEQYAEAERELISSGYLRPMGG